MAARPSTSPLALTGDNLIDSITSGYYWILDSSHTVNWALANGFNGEYWLDPATTKSIISNALNLVSSYVDIKFSYTGYYSTPASAASNSQLTFSLDGNDFIFNSPSTWAKGFFPNAATDASYYQGAAGDVFLNINSMANHLPSYAPGSEGFALLLHEIGHTLGLKHPHDDGGTGHPTFASLGNGILDQDWFSVMSYNDAYDWNYLSWEPYTPMALDVLGLMSIYGPNMATNAGNNYTQLADIHGYSTRWDAAGIDTLSASTAKEGWTIILQATTNPTLGIDVGLATPSSQLDLDQPTSLWWLLGSNENATGSPYSDILMGSDLGNVLTGGGGDDALFGFMGSDTLVGGAGNDAIDGGSGVDTAIFSGNRANFTITPTTTGVTVRDNFGTGGIDTLVDVERLQFSDQTLQATVHPVYRFENPYNGAFLFTATETERESIERNYSFLKAEGIAFHVLDLGQGNNVYRFANTVTGGYFYTASESEKAYVIDHYPAFRFEGAAFALPSSLEGLAAVERFANTRIGAHLLTQDVTEIAALRANGDWHDEGIGFFAPADSSHAEWVAV